MTLNCKGTLINLATPKVMGILNITPDSFYDGGNLTNERLILAQAEKMLEEGATFLDIGGYSSRPGAEDISETEELNRVIPAIEVILKQFPKALISIDTFRSEVAKKSVEAGAVMVNDISAGKLDSNMMKTVAQLKIPYVMMHMKGNPKTMVSLSEYKNVTKEILFYFSEKLAEARTLGMNDVIVDPGFGFAKTRHHNFELLNHLELFKSLEVPLLVGISRKSMIYKTLQTTPEEALNGTTALHSIALLKGASILRVHDVKEAIECVTLLENFKN
ncbi:dihydropteroate synthase [Aureisphaera sp. CAU 1614]|uniref:Dihydropteroate synthase n=1 Tax=Halomarinibacterium sedimenti TaxID=2857106 RepID=A0A9X1FLN2_9FLAO|nr:dihydropteroate synthase [Halomarinibacterium sedimenti]MBW2936548.1 dihydropteroate synthase [Halomarinibacterium sedimenti]